MSLINVIELCRKYSDEFSVEDISFDIEENGIYGFLGKSGSGKTLLCQMLTGASVPDDGVVYVKDRVLYKNQKQTASIKKKIGYVPQSFFYDKDATVMEIMDLIGGIRGIDPDKRYRQIKEALDLTGLSLKTDTLAGDLTVSEKKRLSIAVSIIGNPDILIMDEPFAHLDTNEAEQVERLLGMLGKRKPVLMFTARAQYVERLCVNTAFLHNGRLMLWENTAELLAKLKENNLGGLAEALCALCEGEEEAQE